MPSERSELVQRTIILPSPGKGKGLFARLDLSKGTIVARMRDPARMKRSEVDAHLAHNPGLPYDCVIFKDGHAPPLPSFLRREVCFSQCKTKSGLEPQPLNEERVRAAAAAPLSDGSGMVPPPWHLVSPSGVVHVSARCPSPPLSHPRCPAYRPRAPLAAGTAANLTWPPASCPQTDVRTRSSS